MQALIITTTPELAADLLPRLKRGLAVILASAIRECLLPEGIEECFGGIIGQPQLGPCGLASILIAPSGSMPGFPVDRVCRAFYAAVATYCLRHPNVGVTPIRW